MDWEDALIACLALGVQVALLGLALAVHWLAQPRKAPR